MIRPGYAIEYDYIPATQCRRTLETKLVAGARPTTPAPSAAPRYPDRCQPPTAVATAPHHPPPPPGAVLQGRGRFSFPGRAPPGGPPAHPPSPPSLPTWPTGPGGCGGEPRASRALSSAAGIEERRG